MQHLSLALLAVQCQRRRGDHVAETRQRAIEGAARQLEEEIGMAFTGGRIDLATLGLDEWNQALARRETGASEENQMLQEMREAWVGQGRIMAARVYP
ncbi:hypothetical protein D3C80_1674110 [compost metagenome]